ncbi:MAG TPA: helix-turn-helix domain-containing protein [Solirubrobacteraceae bacterium]|nr:helix-turn-helix domain-containing protein [Solirubrobacteraceae bacterium]
MSVVLGGLGTLRKKSLSQLDDRRLSRSLLIGLLVYASIPADGSFIGIAEIARSIELQPSMIHRYVSTLVAAGLVERNSDTRKYRAVGSVAGGANG